MRERWFGATGRKVPQIAVEGELDVGGALILDELDDGGGGDGPLVELRATAMSGDIHVARA